MFNQFLTDHSVLIGVIIAVLAMVYRLFLHDRLVNSGLLNTEQLDLIDYACERGVEFAEQMYKNDSSVDRQSLALDFAFDIIEKSHIIPQQFLDIIHGMIEAKVNKLPPTNVSY